LAASINRMTSGFGEVLSRELRLLLAYTNAVENMGRQCNLKRGAVGRDGTG
jgi:hypothetical protein